MRRLATAALVAALAGCSARGQFVNDPEASPGARTSSAPTLPPGFTLGEREWIATSYGPDRKSAVARSRPGWTVALANPTQTASIALQVALAGFDPRGRRMCRVSRTGAA
jgi:hypothetical protein